MLLGLGLKGEGELYLGTKKFIVPHALAGTVVLQLQCTWRGLSQVMFFGASEGLRSFHFVTCYLRG